MRELKYLLKIFLPYKWVLLGGVLLSFISSFANIALMGTSGWFITAMGMAGIAGVSMNYFTPASIIRACAILRTLGRYGERVLMHDAALRLVASLRRSFYESFMPLVPEVSGLLRSGEALSRLRGDIDMLERFYLRFLVPVAVAILISAVMLYYLSRYGAEFYFTIAFILCFVFIPALVYVAVRKGEAALVDLMSSLKIELASNLQGMDELSLYDMEDIYSQKFDALAKRIAELQLKLNICTVLSNNCIPFIINITMLATLCAVHSSLAAPDAVMLMFIILASTEPLAMLPDAFQNLCGVLRATQRILDISDGKNPIDGVPQDANPQTEFSMQFENVNFSYDRRHKVINNLSFSLLKGDRLRIEGASGAGKSTLLDLMLKLRLPQSGKIEFSGYDVHLCSGENLRSNFAVLEQRPYIFADTIINNLLLANPQAKLEEIENVCKVAGLHDFIMSLPQGYDTYVGDRGRELSGGQIKRLGLARALLKPNTHCLLLDEPGEGLDYSAEREMIEKTVNFADGKSIVLISHRRNYNADEFECISL